MNDTERVIGELKEFKRATLEELKSLRTEVKTLSEFRWKAAGVVAALMGAVEFVHLWMTKGR